MTGEERDTHGWVEFGEVARELSGDVPRSGFAPGGVVEIARGCPGRRC